MVKDKNFWSEQLTNFNKWQDEAHVHSQGDKAIARYNDKRGVEFGNAKRKFNMFWANVGLLRASLYGNPPHPEVNRTNLDPEDDVARVASEIVERNLKRDLQRPTGDMDVAFKNAVENRMVPGMGAVWLRYEADVKMQQIGTMQVPLVSGEQTFTEFVYWKDFAWSPSRTWDQVWWVARKVHMKKDKFVKRFGKKNVDKINFAHEEKKSNEEGGPKKTYTAPIWEVWDKDDKKVCWLSEDCDGLLDSKDDPYELSNFFPCPKPLFANTHADWFLPVSDYAQVRDQYDQLDILHQRLDLLTTALRVAGAYDQQNESLKTLLSEDLENTLVPVDNWALFAERGGMKGSIDWVPIEMVAAVMDKLEMRRQSLVQQIYELTGLSDILRGATAPRETAKAQEIKAQYASARLQHLQGEVSLFVEEALEIKTELMQRLFKLESWMARISPLPPHDQELIMPALQMLKDWNMSRGRIEIQTDDMAIPDYNLEQKNRVEFVTALGQLLSQAHPMMEMMPGSMPFVLGILQWVCAGFKGGRNVEGLIDKAIREAQKMPKEKDDGEAKAKEAEMQMKQAELQGKLKIMEAQLKVIMQKAQIEQQKGQQDLQLNQQKGEQDLKLTEAKGEVDIENTELKTEADIEAIEDKTEATVASILRKAKAQSEVSANKKV